MLGTSASDSANLLGAFHCAACLIDAGPNYAFIFLAMLFMVPAFALKHVPVVRQLDNKILQV